MEPQLIDRVLICSDCRKDFIFTAGEQLFFLEKQFKNDPKRCKPCKLRRYTTANAANGGGQSAASLSRTETRTECSECKVETTVPFKPSQGRPVLCRMCFQKKNRAVAASGTGLPATALQASADGLILAPAQPAVHLAALCLPTPEVDTSIAMQALASASINRHGQALSHEAALLAVTSMSGSPNQSSIASIADLESIARIERELRNGLGHIPFELLTLAEPPGELVGATAETADA